MNKKLLTYQQQLLSSFQARDNGDLELEDDLLADLDKLWLSMTPSERLQSGEAARRARAQHVLMAALQQGDSASGLLVGPLITKFLFSSITGSRGDAVACAHGENVQRAKQTSTRWSLPPKADGYGQIRRTMALS